METCSISVNLQFFLFGRRKKTAPGKSLPVKVSPVCDLERPSLTGMFLPLQPAACFLSAEHLADKNTKYTIKAILDMKKGASMGTLWPFYSIKIAEEE